MKDSKKRILALVMALTMTLCIVGCGQKTGANGEDNDGPIVVGCIGPITGDSAFYGQLLRDTVTLMADKCNEAGGILGRPVELKIYDDRSDPIEATNAARKAIQQDGVKVFIGTESSATTLALAEVCEENGVPFVATLASNAKITKTEDGKTRPYSFRACLSDPQSGSIMAQYAYDELGIESVATIYNLGSDYSIGVVQNFSDTFTAAGGKIVAQEAYNDGDVDFRAVLTKLKNAGDFDALYVPVGYFKEAGLICKQARELGITQPVVSTDCMMVGKMFEVSGDSTEGAIYPASFIVGADSVMGFLDDFIEKFGYDPSVDSAGDLVCAHDAWVMMEEAVTKAGTDDSEAIRNALENLGTIDILFGTLTVVPETHDSLRTCPIYRIENKEFIQIAEFTPTVS